MRPPLYCELDPHHLMSREGATFWRGGEGLYNTFEMMFCVAVECAVALVMCAVALVMCVVARQYC